MEPYQAGTVHPSTLHLTCDLVDDIILNFRSSDTTIRAAILILWAFAVSIITLGIQVKTSGIYILFS